MAAPCSFRHYIRRKRCTAKLHASLYGNFEIIDLRICDWDDGWPGGRYALTPVTTCARNILSILGFVAKHAGYRTRAAARHLVWLWRVAEIHYHYIGMLLPDCHFCIKWLSANKPGIGLLYENDGCDQITIIL